MFLRIERSEAKAARTRTYEPGLDRWPAPLPPPVIHSRMSVSLHVCEECVCGKTSTGLRLLRHGCCILLLAADLKSRAPEVSPEVLPPHLQPSGRNPNRQRRESHGGYLFVLYLMIRRLSLDTQSTHTYNLPLTFSSLAFAPPLPPLPRLPRLPLPLQRIRHGLGAGGINASAVVYGGSKGCLSAKTAKTVFFLPRPEPVVVYDDLTAIYKWRRPISTSLPYRGVSGYGQDALDSWSGRAQHRIAEEVLPAPMGCWTSAWPKEGRFALLRVFPPFRRTLSFPPIGCWHCFPSSFREAPA